MIRARLTNGDFLFGMDAENIRRLTAGQPVKVDLGPLDGPPISIIIVYGETLQMIADELEKKFGPLPVPKDFMNMKGPKQ